MFDFASSEVSGCDPQSADTSPGGPREPPKPRAAVPPTQPALRNTSPEKLQKSQGMAVCVKKKS